MKERTVTVWGGANATVRATEAAKAKYGDDYTVKGILDTGTPAWTGDYVYRVVKTSK